MSIYLPGLEPPEYNARDLQLYDLILVSISGGKDSIAAALLVREAAERCGVLHRVRLVYADTGMEWTDCPEHVTRVAERLGLPLHTVRPRVPLPERIRERFGVLSGGNGWPSLQCRYCTSFSKTKPIDKLLRELSPTGAVLQVTGERREESEHRAALPAFGRIDRLSPDGKRAVYGWRPVIDFREADVWAAARSTGIEPHRCYSAGCSRLSCVGCILASNRDLAIQYEQQPETIEKLIKLEQDTGFTVKPEKSIRERIKLT
ncbi:phosphoadenosine phosphosulfate reductase family protein [Victivallis vadensis]|uniref:Phosphoadenosine phosphosulfate reductase family protein n=1 Tax=Victivallis vadensis TaxID=172901 RepID=A0A848AU99_9BACT|nr:phosphoadenosine phosphosulfate reductase family protein [Victivallis vadensis]NMD86718.1 phosphoadenosine phosphosulfate reductase family protein [Victivallis vadensis]